MPPTLLTERLILRAFVADDAAAVQQLAGAYEIAQSTLLIPHPYPDGAAAAWIAGQRENETHHVFAVTLRESGEVVGAIGIEITPGHGRGEIGYWIGVPYWGRGFVTEAGRAVVGWAFRELALHRVFAQHFTRNPASGRVMQKLGMKHEGTLRQHDKKWNDYVDVEVYGILRDEWE